MEKGNSGTKNSVNFVTRFLSAELLFGRPPLVGNLFLLARDPVSGAAGAADLELVTDQALLLAVELTLQ